jgi:hypothetical protein
MLLLVRIRAWFDQYRAGFRSAKSVYAGEVGLVLGLVGLVTGAIGPNLGFIVGISGLALSSVILVVDFVERRRGSVEFEREAEVVPPIDAGVGGVIVQHRIVRENHTGSPDQVAIAWPDLDKALPTATTTFTYETKPKPLPTEIAPFRGEIIRQLANDTTYNDPHVRQDDDLNLDVLGPSGVLPLRKSPYFDMVCTNYLAGQQIRDTRTKKVILHGNQIYRNGAGIHSLADGRLANQVGISTIGITTDGRAVLVMQAPKALSSAGLRAPSGSGSVDMIDVRRSRKTGNRLNDLLITAMERELYEESHIGYSEIEWTMVLGYFRWLNKGAKPEYVGVSKLRRTSDELWDRYPRIVETPFVKLILSDCPVDFERLRNNPEDLSFLEPELQDSISMPLFMCFRAFGFGLNRDDEVGARLREFVASTARPRSTGSDRIAL